ncbi:hypothetical protein PROPEN_02042 [Proteus penneri ATCC 35198]|nr:hypothetical protein PROPEN_02042 [Proteus penneri ATCC 35198]
MTATTFSSLELDESLLTALEEKRISTSYCNSSRCYSSSNGWT